MTLENAVKSVAANLKVLTWGVNGKPEVNLRKQRSQELIQPNQTFLDIIKTKLPQRADSIERGEAVVEAKVGEFGTLPRIFAKKVKPGRQFGLDSPSAISKEQSEGNLVGSARRGWRGSEVFRILLIFTRERGFRGHVPWAPSAL